jgi:hypothetical protein
VKSPPPALTKSAIFSALAVNTPSTAPERPSHQESRASAEGWRS